MHFHWREQSGKVQSHTHTHTHDRSPGKSFLLGLISTIFPCFYDPKIQVFGVWPWPGPSFPLFQLPWALSSGLWVLGSALDPALSSPAASRLHFVVANFLLTVVWVFHSLRLPACLPTVLPVLTSICSVHSMPTGAVWTFNCLLFECATAGHGK